MRTFSYIAALLAVVQAQRPNGTSICDFYTTALLKTNNATNQLEVLTLLVNTAVIGNYTSLSKSAVPGILDPSATFNGQPVNLVPYFSGGFVSTNQGGQPASTNFLDGGGAAPLKQNMPANGNTTNQFVLLTHLYSYFGTALGCSGVGQPGFPAYAGSNSMYTVHKFMALGPNEVGYFISQVGAAAASFGVASSDITIVANLLNTTFGEQCSPKAAPIQSQPADLQAICTDPSCPMAANGDCSLYDKFPGKPANASGSGSSSASGSAGGGSSGAGATATSPGGGGSSSSPTASSSAAMKGQLQLHQQSSLGMFISVGAAAAVAGVAILL